MSEIIDIGRTYPLPAYAGSTPASPIRHAPPETTPIEDTVEITRLNTASRDLDVSNRSSFSLAKTRAIRAEIAGGTYETTDRIQGTVERLLDVIG